MKYDPEDQEPDRAYFDSEAYLARGTMLAPSREPDNPTQCEHTAARVALRRAKGSLQDAKELADSIRTECEQAHASFTTDVSTIHERHLDAAEQQALIMQIEAANADLTNRVLATKVP